MVKKSLIIVVNLFLVVGISGYGANEKLNNTICHSLYPVIKEELHQCTIRYLNTPEVQIIMSLELHYCKSPYQATVKKKTLQSSSAEVSEFSKTFTDEDHMYKENVNGKLISLGVRFKTFENNRKVSVKVIIKSGNESEMVILSGLFSTGRDKCSWYSTLSHSEQIGFIVGMTLLFGVVSVILAIICGKQLRKKYPGEKYLFSPYSHREPIVVKERSVTASSGAGLLASQM